MVKKLIIAILFVLLPLPVLGAQQMITSGPGSAHLWPVQKARINANDTELYNKDAAQDATIVTNTNKRVTAFVYESGTLTITFNDASTFDVDISSLDTDTNLSDAEVLAAIQGEVLQTGSGVSLPGTCTVGQLYVDTDADTDGTLYFCRATDTWKDVAVAAAGSDTQVTFNDGGAPNGDSGFVYNSSTNTLTVENLITTTVSTNATDGQKVSVLPNNTVTPTTGTGTGEILNGFYTLNNEVTVVENSNVIGHPVVNPARTTKMYVLDDCATATGMATGDLCFEF